MNTHLFLDDIRNPIDAFAYTKDSIYLEREWVIVRNYEEFERYLQKRSFPEVISFDHDLAPSHYTPEHLWDDYEASKKWQDAQVHIEKTGYDCARKLITYCDYNQIRLPRCLVHSQNPVGRDNIQNLLSEFVKRRGF